MNKRTTTTIMTRLGWGAFFLALIFLAIQVMPRALGQRQSADISAGSSNVEAPLLNQQPTPLTPVITGTLGTAPPGGDTGTLATRINRPGTGPTATCAGVTWPGNIGQGPFIYNVHYFVNNTASPLCTPLTFTMLTQGTPVGNMQLSAFKAPFVATDISNSARYLGDAGASSFVPGVQTTFELTIPANTTIALVVFNAEQAPEGLGGTYQIEFSCGSSPATDFNHNGKPDYVLYAASTRHSAVWYLNNNVFAGSAYGPTLPAGWNVVSVADFNGDGQPDYVLFNPSTRRTVFWYLSGVTFISSASGPTLPSGWALVAVGKFNGDCQPDYVLYNASTRRTAIWYLNNNVFAGSVYGPTLAAGWRLAGVADFNQNGETDYALFAPGTRRTAIWYLSGGTFVSAAYGPTIASGYELTGTADFSGDGKPDYLLYNPSNRRTALYYLNNNVYTGSAYGPLLAAGWNLVAP
jgi:FG-GAP-like repeat